ncbi:hypothetical protein SAG0311_02745 [Streptococcus agalactiae GB00111]|nr:hypothetical protein SAG0311_02745 [Streptococcus agalactiae GB00111]
MNEFTTQIITVSVPIFGIIAGILTHEVKKLLIKKVEKKLLKSQKLSLVMLLRQLNKYLRKLVVSRDKIS